MEEEPESSEPGSSNKSVSGQSQSKRKPSSQPSGKSDPKQQQPVQVTSRLKLIYFPLNGSAEHIRLIFVTAGVHYDDDAFPDREWAELKPSKCNYADFSASKQNKTWERHLHIL